MSAQQKPQEEYRCQFCGETTPAREWVRDKCPKCKRTYDPVLAQEGDD
jgi:lipopolysaccharide biosynthesis regulator YciM